MASVLYRKRGDSNLWTYEIRNEGKTVAHNSGFKTKKLAESEAEPILQELRLGKRISRDISLVDLYQEWLELKLQFLMDCLNRLILQRYSMVFVVK